MFSLSVTFSYFCSLFLFFLFWMGEVLWVNLVIKVMSFISDPCQALVLSVAYPRLVALAAHVPRCRRPFLGLGLSHACSVLSRVWVMLLLKERQEAFFFPSPAHSLPPHSARSRPTLCSPLSSRVKEMAWPPCLAFSQLAGSARMD